MANASPNALSDARTAVQSIVREHRPWFIALGLVLLVLGGLAIMFPLLTTIATKVFIGWLFLIGGVAHVIHAFSTRSWGGFLLDLLEGLLYVFAGVWLAFFPIAGILTLTIFVAFLFIIQGIVESAIAFRVRPAQGWGWMLFAGLAAVLAGGMIIAGLPSTAAWAIGFLVGIKLMTSGWAYLLLALGARS